MRETSDLSRLSSPWELTVKSKQLGFSKVPDLLAALEMCGEDPVYQGNVSTDLFMTRATAQKIIGGPNFNKELEHAWGTIKRLQQVHPNVGGNETTTRSYINPIVIAAAVLSEDITFEEERRIEGPYGNGPVDYAFIYKNSIVCVTEVKDHDMEHGVRQNIAQLAATRSECKRTFSTVDNGNEFTYFGVVTTTYRWKLVELKQNVVKTSRDIPGCDDSGKENQDKERISEVIAHMVNLLKKCKKDYEDVVVSK